MFKVGDRIVCINDSMAGLLLEINKIYIVDFIHDSVLIDVVDTKYNEIGYFNKNRFISLLEYRRKKLEKICSKLEIK